VIEREYKALNMKLSIERCKIQLVIVVKRLNLLDVKWLTCLPANLFYQKSFLVFGDKKIFGTYVPFGRRKCP
jgi:hypothetical protein